MRKLLAVAAVSGALVSCATPTHEALQAGPGVVSIIVVRHAETDSSLATLPLSAIGQERAKLLDRTVAGIRFTHAFASHTTRARQMLEAIAARDGLTITQLPAPGSLYQGEVVTDKTTRRAPVEPISEALLRLPPGSVAIAALNSENIFAIFHKLGVPVVRGCAAGSTCVPCTDNSCYPHVYDRLWHIVLEPGRQQPLSFVELRYGEGWKPAPR